MRRASSVPWSATRASEYLRLGSLLRLKTTMHAEGGVAKDWPGPGATGCNDEGICRDMFGRSIDSSGAGMPVECQRGRGVTRRWAGARQSAAAAGRRARASWAHGEVQRPSRRASRAVGVAAAPRQATS